MINKNIVFLGFSLDAVLNSNYENRIALWKSNYDELNHYNEVIDLGDILSKLFGGKEEELLELELCNRIMNLIDKNTVAIIDTSVAGYSLFDNCKELYNQLNIHLEKINNKDIKFFLCQPLQFMSKARHNNTDVEYTKLTKIMEDRVLLFKEREFTKVSDLKKHMNAFIKYVMDNI